MRSTGPKAAVYQIVWDAPTKQFGMLPTDERAEEQMEGSMNSSPSRMPGA